MPTQLTTETRYVVSADGTRIAYDVTGTGPALVVVDGALCQRSMGPARALAARLAGDFAVHTYDRRGRGESDPGATAYAPEREIDDLGAVIEAPFIVDDTHAPYDADLGDRTRALVDAGRRGEAVRVFMRLVGVPRPMLAAMGLLPVWRRLTSVAHTLPHDYAIVLPHQRGAPLPGGLYAASTTPTLVLAGGRSPRHLRNAQAAVADAVPDARLQVLPGQTHMIRAKVVAPVVARHLAG